MKNYVERIVPERRELVFSQRTCDICGSITKNENQWPDKSGNYDWIVNETKVSWREGTRYPEGGNSFTMSVDICPKCYVEKLIPFLKSLGAEIQEKELNY